MKYMCMTCICRSSMLILSNILMAVDTDENPFVSDDERLCDTDNKSYDESGIQTLSL